MDIIRRVKALNLPEEKFVVIGSAILEIKGIRKTSDLDVMLTEDLFKTIKKDSSWKYTLKAGRFGDSIDLLEKDGVQLYFHIYGRYDFNFFMGDSTRVELIEGVWFGSLSDLLKIKYEWKREKDLADIALINSYLEQHIRTPHHKNS